jgi:hypothetical protein
MLRGKIQCRRRRWARVIVLAVINKSAAGVCVQLPIVGHCGNKTNPWPRDDACSPVSCLFAGASVCTFIRGAIFHRLLAHTLTHLRSIHTYWKIPRKVVDTKILYYQISKLSESLHVSIWAD